MEILRYSTTIVPYQNCLYYQKVLESLVGSQLKAYLHENNILNGMQSGFRSGHSTVSETLNVLNVSVFIDLSKAFDTVDHAVLVQRLKCCGMTGHVLDWFSNYL